VKVPVENSTCRKSPFTFDPLFHTPLDIILACESFQVGDSRVKVA
jgi:hypothetical protein